MAESELETYRAAVEDYARRGVNYLFHNKGDEHALIILSNLFKNAKKHIRIAANRLCDDSVVNTKEYIDSMKTFLDRDDTILDMLIVNAPAPEIVNSCDRENCFYWMIYNHPAYKAGRVHLREGEGRAFRDSKNGVLINFCTGDEKMFRLENNVYARTAIANFNDSDYTSDLIQSFDNIYQNQKAVDLQLYFQNA